MYEMIKDFMGTKPIFHPHHAHDLMQEGDVVYIPLGHLQNKMINSNNMDFVAPLRLESP
jgi:hypothetical protein